MIEKLLKYVLNFGLVCQQSGMASTMSMSMSMSLASNNKPETASSAAATTSSRIPLSDINYETKPASEWENVVKKSSSVYSISSSGVSAKTNESKKSSSSSSRPKPAKKNKKKKKKSNKSAVKYEGSSNSDLIWSESDSDGFEILIFFFVCCSQEKKTKLQNSMISFLALN